MTSSVRRRCRPGRAMPQAEHGRLARLRGRGRDRDLPVCRRRRCRGGRRRAAIVMRQRGHPRDVTVAAGGDRDQLELLPVGEVDDEVGHVLRGLAARRLRRAVVAHAAVNADRACRAEAAGQARSGMSLQTPPACRCRQAERQRCSRSRRCTGFLGPGGTTDICHFMSPTAPAATWPLLARQAAWRLGRLPPRGAAVTTGSPPHGDWCGAAVVRWSGRRGRRPGARPGQRRVARRPRRRRRGRRPARATRGGRGSGGPSRFARSTGASLNVTVRSARSRSSRRSFIAGLLPRCPRRARRRRGRRSCAGWRARVTPGS